MRTLLIASSVFGENQGAPTRVMPSQYGERNETLRAKAAQAVVTLRPGPRRRDPQGIHLSLGGNHWLEGAYATGNLRDTALERASFQPGTRTLLDTSDRQSCLSPNHHVSLVDTLPAVWVPGAQQSFQMELAHASQKRHSP